MASNRVVETLSRRGHYNEECENMIRSMPKVELHVHLDGSFDPDILFGSLQENGNLECLPEHSVLPWDQSLWPVRQLVKDCRDKYDYHALCTCRGKRSLQEMIKSFEIFTPLVRGNLDLIEQLSFDFCRRQAEQRVIYTECRYSPHLLSQGGTLTGIGAPCDPRPVLDAVTKGLRRGSTEFGIIVNQILSCIAWRPDWADSTVELAKERKNDFPCAIVGVDIAAGEEHFDAKRFPHLHEPHFKAMKKAQRLGLNITMHAGEVSGGDNVRCAIEEYGATRIGHGYRILDDPALIRDLKAKNIHIETCPTSSRETGGWLYDVDNKDWTQHPCVGMMNNGINIGFNSDDPAVFNTSLSWQYRTVVAKMKVEKTALLESVEASIDAAFCSNDVKESLRKMVEQFKQGRDVSGLPYVKFDDRVIENYLVTGESI